MNVPTEEPQAYIAEPSVCAIGVFDGVHLGHQALLKATSDDAYARGATSVAVTFDRDPDELFRPQMVHKLLSDEERLNRLGLYVDEVLALRFDEALASEDWHLFLNNLLLRLPGLKAIHVGTNFRCGTKAGGGIPELEVWGAEHDIAITAEPLLVEKDQSVSASRIRALLAEGDVRSAAALLTRPFVLNGKVVEGAGRGSGLGFATANVEVEGHFADMGPFVYACYVYVNDEDAAGTSQEQVARNSQEGAACNSQENEAQTPGALNKQHENRYKAAVSIGKPPTFYPEQGEFDPLLLEAHLLDFEGDLYGKELSLEFVEKLRPMKRFEDQDELIATVNKNISWVRENL